MQTSDRAILDLFHEPVSRDRAFRLLVEKYREKLYYHIRRIVRYHEDADDVLQNTFIKVYKGLTDFRADSQLYTWLFRIATNESINHLKREKRLETVSMITDFGGEEREEVDRSDQLRADPYFDGDQAQVLLHKAIASLPPKQRAVFTLRYFEEMKYKEIADVTGTSVGALKASFHHALKKVEDFVLQRG